MQVVPYLNFDGRCEEAIEFYRGAVGAEVTSLSRFKDMPGSEDHSMVPPEAADKVMHASLRIGDSTVMASDGRCMGQLDFKGISLSITVRNEAEADRVFAGRLMADRSICRWPRPSFPQASAWSPTASGSYGWSS